MIILLQFFSKDFSQGAPPSIEDKILVLLVLFVRRKLLIMQT
jgi:hypothetical protein